MKIEWMGVAPSKCDGCGRAIKDTFYDMATKIGPWACLCGACAYHGIGCGEVGTGRGQRYDRRRRKGGNAWVKTAG